MGAASPHALVAMTDPRLTVPVPPKLAHRPRQGGFIVPFFVAQVDGVYDFRIVDPDAFKRCVRESRCWLCGQTLGRWLASTIGPMCAVTRTTSEPPQHLECAHYAVSVCPFLTQPTKARRETRLPDGVLEPAGEGLKRNPGVIAIWISRERSTIWKPTGGQKGLGVLFTVGAPERVEWWAEGRPATYAEVKHSTLSGLPALEAMADRDPQRELAQRELAKQLNEAMTWWPKPVDVPARRA